MRKLFAGVLTVIMIFASLTGNVVNAEIHHGGALSAVGEHAADEFYNIKYNYNDEIIYIYEYEKLIPDDTLQDILEIFSDECLELSEIQPADIVYPEDSAFPDNGCLQLVTNDDVNYMLHFDNENVLVWRFEIPAGSIPVYQGLFEYKEPEIYSELAKILDDLSAQIIQKRKDDSIERDIQKNTVNISDLKIIYSGQFYAGSWLYDWGVCSYLRENETEPTTVLYRALANQEGVLKLFLISEDVKNNTVYFNNERAIEFTYDNPHGKEYDFDSTTHISQLQIKVTDDMKAEEIAVVQKRPYSYNTFITEEYVITAENMTQKGALPREMFDVFDNKDDLSETAVNKGNEVKKETEDNSSEKAQNEETHSNTDTLDVQEQYKDTETDIKTEAPNKKEEKKTSNDIKKEEDSSKTTDILADTLYDLGLFKGTDNGYELEKTLTREESATILVRLLGAEADLDAGDYEEVFTDVPEDRWSFAYVMYCYDNDITKGTGNNTFSPEAEVTAEEFVTLVLRLMGYTYIEPDTALEESIYLNLLNSEVVRDFETAHEFTRDDMVYVVYRSLMTKTAEGEVLANELADLGVLTDEQAEEFDVYEIEDINEMIDRILG